MPSSKKLVAQSSTSSPSTANLDAMLYVDNIQAWKRNKPIASTPLETWMRDNILHVVESCPKVLAHWKGLRSEATSESLLHRYIAAALEPLDDDVKYNILTGYYEGKAQAGLYNCIKEGASHWAALSPSWIGPPKSDLRAAAVECGWTHARLPGQTSHSLGRPDAARWSQWVPYAHSLAMMHFEAKLAFEKKTSGGSGATPFQQAGQSWARPEDMALAHAMAKHVTGWQYAMSVHPEARPVPPQLQEYMDTLVQVHYNLGSMATLRKTIITGTVSCQQSPDEALALPVLDSLSLGD